MATPSEMFENDFENKVKAMPALARVIAMGRNKTKQVIEVPHGIDFTAEDDMAEVYVRQFKEGHALVYYFKDEHDTDTEQAVTTDEVPPPVEDVIVEEQDQPQEQEIEEPPPKQEEVHDSQWTTPSTTGTQFTGILIGYYEPHELVWGIGLSSTYEVPRFFNLNMQEFRVNPRDISLFSPTAFIVEDMTPKTSYDLQLKAIATTTFKPAPQGDNLYKVDLQEILTHFCNDKIISLSDLLTWHETYQDESTRLLITKATIREIQATDKVTMLTVNDDEGDFRGGVTCFVPRYIDTSNCKKGTTLYLTGRTETIHTPRTEKQRIGLEVCGLYVRDAHNQTRNDNQKKHIGGEQ